VRRLALAAVLLVPAVAAADPDPSRIYVAGGLFAGRVGEHEGYGYDLAAAGRVGDLWLRGALTRLVDAGGGVLEPRVGIEIRNHDNPNVSPFLGLDVGYVDGSRTIEDSNVDSTLRGAFAMARGGIEFGGEHLRLRFEIDLIGAYARTVEPDQADQSLSQTGFQRGANVGLGLVVRM
jgi:hypothetical protein